MTVELGELSGAWNFRDVGEHVGIRRGRLFRSSELSGLDEAGRRQLSGYGISDVADLRSNGEIERRGIGRVPAGVTIHQLPFRDGGAQAPHEHGFEYMIKKGSDEEAARAAHHFMAAEYGRYPGMDGAQRALRQTISLLADERRVITHCFAGKDRTGYTVAVVLEAVGVDRDAILADFLRSNDAVPELRQMVMRTIRLRTEAQPGEVVALAEDHLADEVLGVREGYLHAAQKVIDAEYGSVTNYLDAIGVTSEQLRRLRSFLQ